MSKFTEKAAAALDLLPEELQEPAVAYILEQAEKFRALKADIQAMGQDEARATAPKEAAQQMMAKNDIEGCKSHIHSAMEATEK